MVESNQRFEIGFSSVDKHHDSGESKLQAVLCNFDEEKLQPRKQRHNSCYSSLGPVAPSSLQRNFYFIFKPIYTNEYEPSFHGF